MKLPHPRIYLIQRLRDELLGPRGGVREVLPPSTDPREEYTTGVLDRVRVASDEETELEALEASEPEVEVGALLEDEDSDPLWRAAEFAPTIDPRLMPSSLGISFVALGAGEFSVCLSCGRYGHSEGGWTRQSLGWVSPKLSISERRHDLVDQDSGMRMLVRSRPLTPGRFQISVYLVNTGVWPGLQERRRVTALLFQPQIRVLLESGVELGEMLEGRIDDADSEESRLALLYRNSPIRGRGHMCAAIWKAIDPEQIPDSPFVWVDRSDELSRFARCDIRSELLPMVPVATPLMSWRHEFGPEPVREAKRLSEMTCGESLRRALEPLLVAYGAWLERQQTDAAQLSENYREVAQRHLAAGRAARERMQQGLDLLAADPRVRLAFLFANRALHEQASWDEQRPALAWRPFQLGFILQCLPGLVDPTSADREICDLLWFPTGGGKTEAYLGLTAFLLGYRRLREDGPDGTGVLSRYTLRLLAIQQFRRALQLITACEMLRVKDEGRGIGWRPKEYSEDVDWLWGRHRFSAGLWLGSAVTPNALETKSFPPVVGALDLLRGRKGEGEPAQVLECPVCQTLLCLTRGSESPGRAVSIILRLTGYDGKSKPTEDELSTPYIRVGEYQLVELHSRLWCLRITLEDPDGGVIGAETLDEWWGLNQHLFGTDCAALCCRPSRPGYFIAQQVRGGRPKDWKVEVYCPNWDCPTSAHPWREQWPVRSDGESGFEPVIEAFRSEQDETLGLSSPIPAVTVDDQIYSWPPSLVVSTVDKLARLAYEPRAGSLFGNVEYYHPREGYYRSYAIRKGGDDEHPTPAKARVEVDPLPPPELVLQDELHLIDGPLGSMVGLYETVVEALCGREIRPKYIASTATVREARDQVQSLFCRELRQFPPSGLDAADSFFALLPQAELTQTKGSGRVYVGYCAPGRGALTPLIRVWAVVLQAIQELRAQGVPDEELDPYWSPVGYFTAIRKLATVSSLWRHYIPQRLQYMNPEGARDLGAPVELSSRVDSHRLPNILSHLASTLPNAVDGVLATSMFGTGVDVSRLSLMLVHGQPKTTSSYIQATGRVGRSSPGLVVTAYSAARPRGLDHYEFFTGYHRQLYRGVEPVTVFPFAPRARERALGPMCVALLRQLQDVSKVWRGRKDGARAMPQRRESDEVESLVKILVERCQQQPELRRPDALQVEIEVRQALDTWCRLASEEPELQYEEYTLNKPPSVPVVLGDPQHTINGLPTAFANSPQSLREIEPTTGFQI